jgi:hypothetical protein
MMMLLENTEETSYEVNFLTRHGGVVNINKNLTKKEAKAVLLMIGIAKNEN